MQTKLNLLKTWHSHRLCHPAGKQIVPNLQVPGPTVPLENV